MTGNGAELLFLPLGGAGEIGMNLNLYGYGSRSDHDWLMFDLGISFGDDAALGASVVMPDPLFIAERRDRLLALVLTHGHEDHLGAVAHLWPQLRCPVYGTPFAVALLERKLAEAGLNGEVPVRPLPAGGELTIGPFDLRLIGMTHSIPEAHAVAIRTPLGTVLHSGDWKLDPDPVIGGTADEAGLRRLGDEGVLALVCDSTNVFERGHSGSEGDLYTSLLRLIEGCAGRVVVTCFASNIARLHTIARAAQATDRSVVITGASLKRNYDVALACNYLADVPSFISDDLGGYLPRERTLIISTGGQGEANAALLKLAADDHPRLSLDPGDTVIFSSRVIPGNERAIGRLQNLLLRRGIEVLTHRHGLVHVSGHPAQEELTRLYDLVRPQVAVPVHGELRHMIEHARLAERLNVPRTVIAENGTLVRLAPGPAEAVDRVPSGRLALDGNRLISTGSSLWRERSRALFNGAVFVTVFVSRRGRRAVDIQISSVGLLDEEEQWLADGACESVRKSVDALGDTAYNNNAAVAETARLAVRRAFRQILDKRPVTHVHVVRT